MSGNYGKVRLICLLAGVFAVNVGLGSSAFASSFITEVLNYSPGPSQYTQIPDPDQRALKIAQFMDSSKATGAPIGAPANQPSNSSVVTLGDGGSITMAFDHDVIDDPANPGGFDFIVFSNAYWIGNNPALRWQEPAFVEISQNGVTWYLLRPNHLPSELLALGAVGNSGVVLNNYAEYTPTLAKPASRTEDVEFYTIPDRQSVANDLSLLRVDAVSGGGDAFDIATAVRESAPGVPALDANQHEIPAGITSFRYIRCTDAVYEGTSDPELGEISAEIDAVADVDPAISVGTAKTRDANTFAVIWNAKVTAVFPGQAIWIQQPDRLATIKVSTTTTVNEGDTVAVTGHIAVDDKTQERSITDSIVAVFASGSTSTALGVANKAITSSMLSGQLVRVWGKRTASDSSSVTIDDGSGQPVKVDCGTLFSSPITYPFLSATGIVIKDALGSTIVRIRRTDDIKAY